MEQMETVVISKAPFSDRKNKYQKCCDVMVSGDYVSLTRQGPGNTVGISKINICC